MPSHPYLEDERASLAQPSQSSSSLECTSHLGFSLGVWFLDVDQRQPATVRYRCTLPFLSRLLRAACTACGKHGVARRTSDTVLGRYARCAAVSREAQLPQGVREDGGPVRGRGGGPSGVPVQAG